jgi:hypothetical protein
MYLQKSEEKSIIHTPLKENPTKQSEGKKVEMKKHLKKSGQRMSAQEISFCENLKSNFEIDLHIIIIIFSFLHQKIDI